MMIRISESGMTFGPFPDEQCFHIEKSSVYQTIGDGVKIAEFVLARIMKGILTVYVVEAKSSSPRPETQPNFEGFIGEIRDKLLNAFSLCLCGVLGRHPNMMGELPRSFIGMDLARFDARFVLVISKHKEEWLDPLKDELNKVFRATMKVWGFSDPFVIVLNEDLARARGLIDVQVGNDV